MVWIIFPRRNRENDRQRTRSRSRSTYIPVYHSRRSAAFIKLYLDPLSRGIRRGILSVNAWIRRFVEAQFPQLYRCANPESVRKTAQKKQILLASDHFTAVEFASKFIVSLRQSQLLIKKTKKNFFLKRSLMRRTRKKEKTSAENSWEHKSNELPLPYRAPLAAVKSRINKRQVFQGKILRARDWMFRNSLLTFVTIWSV